MNLMDIHSLTPRRSGRVRLSNTYYDNVYARVTNIEVNPELTYRLIRHRGKYQYWFILEAEEWSKDHLIELKRLMRATGWEGVNELPEGIKQVWEEALPGVRFYSKREIVLEEIKPGRYENHIDTPGFYLTREAKPYLPKVIGKDEFHLRAVIVLPCNEA